MSAGRSISVPARPLDTRRNVKYCPHGHDAQEAHPRQSGVRRFDGTNPLKRTSLARPSGSPPPAVLVVGSVALDTIETPSGRATEVLGGSATYFALACRLFAPTCLVANVGTDFPPEHIALLERAGVDLAGLKIRRGRTFRWSGRYAEDMNVRETLAVELNVFGEYEPEVPEARRATPFLFLANGSPEHQMRVIERMEHTRLVVVDTMDHWIRSHRDALRRLFSRVSGVTLNDAEARLLTGGSGPRAAEVIRAMGPDLVVIKKGEHGAMMFWRGQIFALPAFPTPRVADPTGAGDCFAGAMMGYIARAGRITLPVLRRALAYATVVASFNVEEFGVSRLASLTLQEVEDRMHAFRRMVSF